MEKQRVGLDALRPGQRGILCEILMPDDAKSRMEELGLLPDTELSCLYRASCQNHILDIAFLQEN